MEQNVLRDTPQEENSTFAARFSAIQDLPQQTLMAAMAPRETASAALPNLTLQERMPSANYDPSAKSVVVVDKTQHHTHVLQMQNGRVVEVLNIPDATGKGPKATPEGRFNIIAKETNPTWYPPPSIGGRPVGPGPKNPLGVAKIRTDAFEGRILLHGTNRPDQIGTNASHGCIRHLNEDIMKLYSKVERGDAVYITKNFSGTRLRPEDFGRRR